MDYRVYRFFLSIISILSNLYDYSALWPNLSMALISLLYCGIINVAIVIPFTILIKKRLNVEINFSQVKEPESKNAEAEKGRRN